MSNIIAGVVTRGLGNDNKLVTRGFGFTLVVVVTGGGPAGKYVYEPYRGPLIPDALRGAIRTQTIFISPYKSPITVDVLHVEEDRKGIILNAILENPKYPYKEIIIRNIDEVEYYD
jgi:hypothetical protein